MKRDTWNWIGLGAAAVMLAGVLGARQHALGARQTAFEAARVQHQQRERLEAQRARLRRAQPDAGELANLRADRAALAALRAEVAELRTRTRPPARAPVASPTATPGPAQPLVPVGAWRNAGRATPEAALETAFWAAAAGELDVLAQLLVLEPEARDRAQALLDGLPPTARAQHATPERLIALLTAKQIPLGAMQLVAAIPREPGAQLLRVRVQAPEGWARTISVAARGAPGDWRLVVPAAAVDRLALQLTH